jgi:hypothetical protein
MFTAATTEMNLTLQDGAASADLQAAIKRFLERHNAHRKTP